MADVGPAPLPSSSSRFQPYNLNPYVAARSSLKVLQDSLWELGRDKRLASEERKRAREAARAEAAAVGDGAVVDRARETSAPEARNATAAAAVGTELGNPSEAAGAPPSGAVIKREAGRDGTVWETKTTRTRTCRTKEWTRVAEGTGAASKASKGVYFRNKAHAKP